MLIQNPLEKHIKKVVALMVTSVFLPAVSYGEKPEISYWKMYKSDKLRCGDVIVTVKSQCYDRDEKLKDHGSGGIIRICKSATMTIAHGSQLITTSLPYVPDTQRQALESAGYKLDGMMKDGQWSPERILCVATKRQLVLVTSYATNSHSSVGMLQLENTTPYSLYTHPVVTDLNGNFVDKATEKYAQDISNQPYSPEVDLSKVPVSISINGVYGDEAEVGE